MLMDADMMSSILYFSPAIQMILAYYVVTTYMPLPLIVVTSKLRWTA